MNLQPELQERLDGTKQDFANGKLSAYGAVERMFGISHRLPETARAEFATGIMLPFVQKAYANGALSVNDAAGCIFQIANRLHETAREPFLNELGIFEINLKTKAWDSLTAGWGSANDRCNKMVLYTRGYLGNSEPFAKCGCEEVTMDNFKSLFDKYDIRGRARSPFLKAVEAVKIEQEHSGFFAGFNRMCRSLKTPEVG